MMKRALLVLGTLALLAWLGLSAALHHYQRQLIYYPSPSVPGAQANTSLLAGVDVPVLVSARSLPSDTALLYFGGNAEQVSASLPALAEAFPRAAIFLLHYRGYSGSGGTPSEKALVGDALALFDQVHAQHPRVIVIGRSLGSGIAIQVASARPVARLVLVTPFDSLQDVAADAYPWFPVRWLLEDKYESWRRAPRISAPTLVLAAEHDEVIPARNTARLLRFFRPGVARLQVIGGVGHNTISRDPGYLPLLAGHAR